MPMWFPAAYMKAPANICMQRIFWRVCMSFRSYVLSMPWVVLQMCITSSQARTAW